MSSLRSILTEHRFIGRAAAGFGLVTAITALTAISSAIYARDASTKREQILTAYATDLTSANRAQLAAERMVAVGRGYLLAPDAETLQRFRGAESQLDGALDALDHAGAAAHERELLAQARRSAVHYRTMFDDIIEAGDQPGAARAEMLRDRLVPAREGLGARLEELVDHKRELQDAARGAARRIDVRTFVFIASIGVAGAILSVMLALGVYEAPGPDLPARAGRCGARQRRRGSEGGSARQRRSRPA
jgi:CHASE3 domain sensor protein